MLFRSQSSSFQSRSHHAGTCSGLQGATERAWTLLIAFEGAPHRTRRLTLSNSRHGHIGSKTSRSRTNVKSGPGSNNSPSDSGGNITLGRTLTRHATQTCGGVTTTATACSTPTCCRLGTTGHTTPRPRTCWRPARHATRRGHPGRRLDGRTKAAQPVEVMNVRAGSSHSTTACRRSLSHCIWL